MILFICGPAANEVDRHATLRKDISAGGATTETAVVGAVAALIATHLGMTAGMLVPFVCNFLLQSQNARGPNRFAVLVVLAQLRRKR